jgi:hypothetical protein
MSTTPDRQAIGSTDTRSSFSRFRPYLPLILLTLTLILALLLRLQGITWGMPTAAHPHFSFHPDEAPHIVAGRILAVDGSQSYDFIYGGTLYFRILSLFTPLGHVLNSITGDHYEMAGAILSGRLFMTLIALITIALIYRVGLLLFNRRVGLLAAMLLAIAPAHVVWAQRVRPDELAAFFALVLFYLAVKLYLTDHHRIRYLYAAAFVTGIAVAYRFPLLLFALPAGVTFVRSEWAEGRGWRKYVPPIGYSALIAIVGYFLGSPQSLSSPQQLIAGLQTQWAYQSSPFFPAIGRGPGIYQYGWTMMSGAITYPIYLLALVGAVVGIRKRSFGVLLLLAALLPYFVLTTFTSWVLVRYLLPTVPFMALLAAYASDRWLNRAPRLATTAVGASIVAVAMLSFAYTRMEAGTDVHDMATKWAAEHMRAGSVVVKVVGYPGDFFSNMLFPADVRVLQLPLKNGADPVRLLDFVRPNYITIGNLYLDDLKRLGTRYPGQRAQSFYRALTAGDYVLRKQITKSPTLLGMNLQFFFSAGGYRLANPTIYIYERARRAN